MEQEKKTNTFISKVFGYIKLCRMHHYLKNVLILLPLVCALLITDLNVWLKVIPGFFAFCLLSSAVYIFNDLKDVNKDRNHPKKCHRPIASGVVSIPEAIVLMAILLAGAIVLNFLTYSSYVSWILLGSYVIVNVCYTLGLKNVPIIDVVLLSSGYFIRTFYGSIIADVVISNWMYLTILMVSFFLGLGKRRNELVQLSENHTRKVLEFYNQQFLDKFMYLTLALGLVFYSLWCVDPSTLNDKMIWTIPFAVVLAMKYGLDIEKNSDGDPIEVIIHDKLLILLGLAYAVTFGLLLYL